MPKLDFRMVRLIVYTLYQWIAIVAPAAAQNALHKANSGTGSKRDRLAAQGHLTYPTAQSIVVQFNMDDIVGISVGIMLAAGFLGNGYALLQNGISLEQKEKEDKLWRWLARLVRWVNSARGHWNLLVSTVILWVVTLVTAVLATWIALDREQHVKMDVDGVRLSQEAVDTIERAINMPTRYWGYGFVRFMCISVWVQLGITFLPFALHLIAYRRLRHSSTTNATRGSLDDDPSTDARAKASVSTERIALRELR